MRGHWISPEIVFTRPILILLELRILLRVALGFVVLQNQSHTSTFVGIHWNYEHMHANMSNIRKFHVLWYINMINNHVHWLFHILIAWQKLKYLISAQNKTIMSAGKHFNNLIFQFILGYIKRKRVFLVFNTIHAKINLVHSIKKILVQSFVSTELWTHCVTSTAWYLRANTIILSWRCINQNPKFWR